MPAHRRAMRGQIDIVGVDQTRLRVHVVARSGFGRLVEEQALRRQRAHLRKRPASPYNVVTRPRPAQALAGYPNGRQSPGIFISARPFACLRNRGLSRAASLRHQAVGTGSSTLGRGCSMLWFSTSETALPSLSVSIASSTACCGVWSALTTITTCPTSCASACDSVVSSRGAESNNTSREGSSPPSWAITSCVLALASSSVALASCRPAGKNEKSRDVRRQDDRLQRQRRIADDVQQARLVLHSEYLANARIHHVAVDKQAP